MAKAKPTTPAPAPAPAPAPKRPVIEALRDAARIYHHDKERKTAGGNVSVDNGDDLAARLRGQSLDTVYAEAAKVLGCPESELRAKYSHLNAGMQRMNLGNKIRGATSDRKAAPAPKASKAAPAPKASKAAPAPKASKAAPAPKASKAAPKAPKAKAQAAA